MNIKKQLDLLLDIPNQILNIQNNIAKIWNQLYEDKPTNRPFVVIFIKAVKVISKPVAESSTHIMESRKIISNIPVTMAVYGYAPHIFAFQPDIEIANLEIAVICDISKVRIEDMAVANVHLCPDLQAAPLAYFNGQVKPWNKITVDTRLW